MSSCQNLYQQGEIQSVAVASVLCERGAQLCSDNIQLVFHFKQQQAPLVNKLLFLNARLVKGKLIAIQALISNELADLACIIETCLKETGD